MPSSVKTKAPTVCILAVPESSGAVMYGLYEVLAMFSTAWSHITGETNQPAEFDVRIVAESADPFTCVGGVPVTPHSAISNISRTDVVIVTDLSIDPTIDHHDRWEKIKPWLRNIHGSGGLVCSVCSGSVMLAASGLLDNKSATTHWAFIDHFSKFYPEVDLQPGRVLIPDSDNNKIVTTGGMAAWEDLALYLIARFYGEADAIKAAKLFLFGDRSEGQLLFSAMSKPRRHDDAVISEAQAWVAENYELANPVYRMVDRSGLAERTFKRRFKRATGFSPMDYVQTLRVEEAKHLLVTSVLPIDTVGRETGYEDDTAFRRLFKRMTGVTPTRYRLRFQRSVLSGS